MFHGGQPQVGAKLLSQAHVQVKTVAKLWTVFSGKIAANGDANGDADGDAVFFFYLVMRCAASRETLDYARRCRSPEMTHFCSN